MISFLVGLIIGMCIPLLLAGFAIAQADRADRKSQDR